MPDIGIIYYADGVKNLYRKNIALTTPLWNSQCSFQILRKRLANLKTLGEVLLLPKEEANSFNALANESKIEIIDFDSSKIIEKAYALNQQHWFLENSSGNDSWYGAAFAKVFEKNKDWKVAILIPLTNLLIDPSEVEKSLQLHLREAFEISFAEERIPGAEWAIFNRDLILGLNKSHPEIMNSRGVLYWAARKPLYPFKAGSYHCPRIRPSINVNMRLNSLRALHCYRLTASEGFDSPDFSYGEFLEHSGWARAYADYAPLQVNVEPSSFCNARCRSCPNQGLKREKSLLSLEAFSKAIADIEDKDQRIVFSGLGEPLLNKDIGKMLDLVSSFCVTLQTSLQIMPSEAFPYKAIDHIRLSIDSDNQRAFENLRPGCSWENIQNFLEKSSELKTIYEAKFPEIGLDFLRRGISEADVLPFIKKWKGKSKAVFNENFFASKPEKISWYQISGESAYCGAVENTSTVDFEPVKRRLCRHAILGINILSDGSLTGCPFDSEGNLFYLGNLKENTVLEVWHSDRAKAWREDHLNGSFPESCYCKNCHDWYRNF